MGEEKKMMKMNKRGATDVAAFVVIIVVILMLAPIALKSVNTAVGSFSAGLNSSSVEGGAEAAATVTGINETFVDFWDWVIAIAFLVNILLLFIFAFMVDSHPIFALFYFIGALFMLIFSHYVLTPVEQILGMGSFSTEVMQMPITNFIITQFDLLLLGIIIVTGIIMYGKFRGAGGGFQR